MNEMIDDYEFVCPFSLLKENRKPSWGRFWSRLSLSWEMIGDATRTTYRRARS